MRVHLVILALLGALVAPSPARSATTPARLDPLPADVRAGQVVTLRWSDPGADVEELEVLLSLDDGRTFPLRISPELDGRTRTLRWRVPGVATGAARLRIRAGEAHREIEGEVTPAFRIVGDDGEVPLVHEGLWWTRLGAPRGGATSALSGDAPAWGAPGGAISAVTIERTVPLGSRADGAPVRETGTASNADATHALIRHGTAPARVHPRN
jgi:hypothetical protein